MQNSRFHKILNSVFLKLLLVIVITGVCINLVVGGFFMYFYMLSVQNTPFRKNVVQYLEYVIHDLGFPPDYQRAKGLSQKLSLEIRCEGPDTTWTTSQTLPPVHDMHLRKFTEHPLIFIGRSQGKSFIVFKIGQNQYTFDLIKSYEHQSFAEAFNSMTARIKEMLHSREQLLLNVSHELRSPLTRMKVAMEFLPETSVKKNLKEDISEMETMISEILETERLKSEHGGLQLQQARLDDIIKEVITGFASDTYPDIIFENKTKNTVLNLDRERIKTVLKNILNNAIKYSEGCTGVIRVSLERQHPYILLQIEDSGKGIPAEDLPHIFEPFYRVDKSRDRKTGGYGLGLSLCKTIMNAHKGKIEIKSDVDKGTKLTLFFRAS